MSDSVTPQTAAHQASLSFCASWSLLKLMSIALVMPSNHLIKVYLVTEAKESIYCWFFPIVWCFPRLSSSFQAYLLLWRVDYLQLGTILYVWASLVAQTEGIRLQCRRPRFDPWVGKIAWRRKWQPTLGVLPGESLGYSSYSLWVTKSWIQLSD